MSPDPKLSIKQDVVMSITGEQQSTVIDKSKHKLMSIIMPSAWTAADITFSGCLTKDGTFNKVVQGSDETELVIKASASEIIGLDSAALRNTLAAIPFIKLRSGVSGELEVEDCEDVWNELVDGDVTQTVDSTDLPPGYTGTYSIKWVIAAAMAAGDIIATEVVSLDLSTYKSIRLWIKSSIATVAGNLKLLLDDHALCASPTETLSIPALEVDTWTEVNLTIGTPASCSAIISIGMENDSGLEGTVRINYARAFKEIPQAAERTFNIALMR